MAHTHPGRVRGLLPGLRAAYRLVVVDSFFIPRRRNLRSDSYEVGHMDFNSFKPI